jgi:hypothetical protein
MISKRASKRALIIVSLFILFTVTDYVLLGKSTREDASFNLIIGFINAWVLDD